VTRLKLMVTKLMLDFDNGIVEHMVSESVGSDVLPLLRKLKRKKEVSELELAEIMEADVNTVRNQLYRMHQHNLVFSERRRDESNGWYVYWWGFQPKGLQNLFTRLSKKSLAELEKKLQRESSTTFYACEKNCARLEFEDAYSIEFRCPECGELMHLREADKDRIQVLKRQIAALKATAR